MPEKKLKICHFITRMIVGGAQENTLLSVIGQIEKGHDVTLLTGPSPGPEGELLKQSKLLDSYKDRVRIITVPEVIRAINPLVDIKAYFKLKKLFRKEKFDVVHTHASKAGIIGRAAAWAVKIPYVVHTVHGPPFHRFATSYQNYIYKTAERWAAKKCHKIYAVAQAMIDQYVEADIAPCSKFKLVYSGMELESFLDNLDDNVAHLNIPDSSPVIGTVARLFPLKGYEFFIPAAAKIVKNIPDIRFLIVGNGIWYEKLLEEIRELGIEENFIFAGLVPPSEVYKYIAEMDLLVHLSLREGLPRAIVQALASGKPAIGYRLDGTPEVVIDGETGYTFEAGNIDDVADVAVEILNNPDIAEKLGDNGRKLVKEKFDWRQMVDILTDDYLENV